MSGTQTKQYLDGLRTITDLVESTDVPAPQTFANVYSFGARVRATWTAETPEELRALLRTLGSSIGSPWKKNLGDAEPTVTRDLDDVTRLVVVAGYAVCSQVQVGETVETVEKVVEPARTEAVEETVPVYEWRCPESLFEGIDAVEVSA